MHKLFSSNRFHLCQFTHRRMCSFTISSASFRGTCHCNSSLSLQLNLICFRFNLTPRPPRSPLRYLYFPSCHLCSPSELHACSFFSHSCHCPLFNFISWLAFDLIKMVGCHPEVSTPLPSALHQDFLSSCPTCTLHFSASVCSTVAIFSRFLFTTPMFQDLLNLHDPTISFPVLSTHLARSPGTSSLHWVSTLSSISHHPFSFWTPPSLCGSFCPAAPPSIPILLSYLQTSLHSVIASVV